MHSSTCFEHYYAHRQEDLNVSIQHLVPDFVTLLRWPFGAQVKRGRSPLLTCAPNRFNKEIVHQVGKQDYIEIVRVPSQCILSVMNVIINNQETFQWNSSIHNINTRNKHHLHGPDTKLSYFQKSTFYSGIKIFNNLWSRVTFLKNDKAKFKAALITYLHTQSFYSVDEFFV